MYLDCLCCPLNYSGYYGRCPFDFLEETPIPVRKAAERWLKDNAKPKEKSSKQKETDNLREFFVKGGVYKDLIGRYIMVKEVNCYDLSINPFSEMVVLNLMEGSIAPIETLSVKDTKGYKKVGESCESCGGPGNHCHSCMGKGYILYDEEDMESTENKDETITPEELREYLGDVVASSSGDEKIPLQGYVPPKPQKKLYYDLFNSMDSIKNLYRGTEKKEKSYGSLESEKELKENIYDIVD